MYPGTVTLAAKKGHGFLFNRRSSSFSTLSSEPPNFQLSTLNPQLSTLNFQLSTLLINSRFLFSPLYLVRFTAECLNTTLKVSSVSSCHSASVKFSRLRVSLNKGSWWGWLKRFQGQT